MAPMAAPAPDFWLGAITCEEVQTWRGTATCWMTGVLEMTRPVSWACKGMQVLAARAAKVRQSGVIFMVKKRKAL